MTVVLPQRAEMPPPARSKNAAICLAERDPAPLVLSLAINVPRPLVLSVSSSTPPLAVRHIDANRTESVG